MTSSVNLTGDNSIFFILHSYLIKIQYTCEVPKDAPHRRRYGNGTLTFVSWSVSEKSQLYVGVPKCPNTSSHKRYVQSSQLKSRTIQCKMGIAPANKQSILSTPIEGRYHHSRGQPECYPVGWRWNLTQEDQAHCCQVPLHQGATRPW